MSGSESIYRNQTPEYGGSSLKESDIPALKFRVAEDTLIKSVQPLKFAMCVCAKLFMFIFCFLLITEMANFIVAPRIEF